MNILAAAALLRARQVSSVELTKASLAAIAARNGALNAMQTVMESCHEEAARADAERAAGEDRGPLHGIPVAVKDLFCTAGVRTTCGSKLFADYVPSFDAAVVEKLRAAGAVILGKTGMHELAYGITSNNPHFGAIRNPHDVTRIPGGSSGGSGAAVADGMVFMAMGSDTGGSIRIPAAFCGTVGLKPTFGRVSKYGAMPLGFSLDHMGPLTRTVRDAALVLNAIAGHDARDVTSSRREAEDYLPAPEVDLRGFRIGRPENFYLDRLVPEMAAAMDLAFQRAAQKGAEVVTVRVPDIDGLNAVSRVLLLAEAAAALENHLHRRADISPEVMTLLDQGRLVPATDYINAQRLRRVFAGEFRKLFERIDCLFTPTAPFGAPRIGQATVMLAGVEEDTRLATTRALRGINTLGYPAISIPCGRDGDGMPLGFQIIAKPFAERRLLHCAAAMEF